ncbi:MAG: glycerol-3-phosphate 1-O-acyltransferase [Gemmatimonadetes bacterium]|nr:glycerol-3-phosphate 1-O-acyltransferase [Gemmatimonadota bacterium]
MTYVLLVLAYVSGSIPTSFLIGKVFHGIDLREHGSGNLGATNAFRVLGMKSALPVVLVDVAKGFLPVWLFTDLAGAGFGWTLAFGAAAIMGHMFSAWVGFRGGKGIATSAGVFLALAPWAVLGGLLVWCAVTFPTGYVSVGSIVTAATVPLLVALTPHEGGASLLWFSGALAAFVIWAHRGNIRRLAKGEEHRFGRRGRSAEGGGEPKGFNA